MKLKVTDTETGTVWIRENANHYWEELCLFIMDRHKDFSLIWCDIEGLLRLDSQWYMLDECGKWEYLPEEFIVEELKTEVSE